MIGHYTRIQYLLQLSYDGGALSELPYDGLHVGIRYFVANTESIYQSYDVLVHLHTVELLPAQAKQLRAPVRNGDVLQLNDIIHGLSK